MPVARGTRIRLGYAGGSMVTGVFTTLPGLLLLPYLTDTLGVGAALAGALVLLPKVWDVLLTPTAGRLGDRGRRTAHLLLGGAGAAAGFALTFAGLARGLTGALLTTAGFLVTATAFAFFHAAYAALPGDLAATPEERIRLVGARVAGIAVAALSAGALAPAVVAAAGGGLAAHRWAGLLGAVLILAGTLATHAATRVRAHPGASGSAGAPGSAAGSGSGAGSGPDGLLRPWALLRGRREFTALLLCVILQVAATGCLLAGGPYFAEHALHAPGLTGALVAAFVLPNLLTVPLWTRAGARWGQRTGLRAATAVFAAACLLLAATALLPAACALPVFLLLGTGHAGQLLFLYGMLAETTASEAGRPRAGALAGLFGGAESLGLALGPFLYALALDVSGYASSDTGHAAAQSHTAQLGVVAGMAVLPALAALAGVLALRIGHRGTTGPSEPSPAPQDTGTPVTAGSAAVLR
ncbi:MFS transporter [Streptomyces sp. NPDC046866]|uniref:MFS transporter n=1 Tax=Streptomyces sp. NPDC046866 TaxID=3154921 RepID=UPI00345550B3